MPERDRKEWAERSYSVQGAENGVRKTVFRWLITRCSHHPKRNSLGRRRARLLHSYMLPFLPPDRNFFYTMASADKPPNRTKQLANELFRKQVITLFKKANRLWEKYDAEMYMVARRNGRYYIFTSAERPAWPPDQETLVRLPCRSHTSVTDFAQQDRYYPVPIVKKPSSFDPSSSRLRNEG